MLDNKYMDFKYFTRLRLEDLVEIDAEVGIYVCKIWYKQTWDVLQLKK